MVRFFQIYKKAFAFNVLTILLGVALNSCASKTTDLFLKTDSTALEDKLLPKVSVVPIDKSCTYYFGFFSTGEYDKFDSNIYDQLRGSLLSEARYNYPDYDVQNLSQSEQKGLLKTVYKVEADLVLRKAIREKLNLIVNHTAINTVQLDSSESEELPAANQLFSESIDTNAKEKPLALKEEFYGEAEKLVVLLEKVKSETTQLKTTDDEKSVSISSYTDNREIHEEKKNTISVITEVGLPNHDTELNVLTSVRETEKKDEVKQLERVESEVMSGETVYIVACFQKEGFVEEKVLITEEELGHPLKYYVTDKWIRVYLSDVRSSQEAKSIYFESWPCRYGK
ncbi:MAG: Uncharacterised protein [Flavobacteriaceae bacterium]|nr:MAG: Uncharacterised protein [Flavobacteriaceae bacterium]